MEKMRKGKAKTDVAKDIMKEGMVKKPIKRNEGPGVGVDKSKAKKKKM